MIISKSHDYYRKKVSIDKKNNKSTAYKIQFYNNNVIDNYVKSYNEGVPVKPAPATMYAELSILNKPQVYANYNRIINSKYTSNDNLQKMFVKNQANKDLNRIVEKELERIVKNLNYVEKVLGKYEIQQKEYQKLLNEQAEKSMANRQKILNEVAIKSNDLLVSEGLNIPSAYSYRNLDITAESLMRQSQMGSKFDEIQAINEEAIKNGKDAPYNSKQWIWTGAGATTRHESNNMQKVKLDEAFIIVNDNTLEIDELMYPSDPAGSPSNVYICYCEVEYLTDEIEDELDFVNTNVNDWKPEVSFQNGLTVDLNQPTLPTSIPQFFQDAKVKDIFNEQFKTKVKGEEINVIDVSNIEKVSSSKYGEGYIVNTEQNLIYNEVTGKAYYKGLEADVFKYDEDIDYGLAFFKKESVLEHNKQFMEVINAEDLVEGSTGNYLVDKYDGIKLNEATGKYEFKGIEFPEYKTTGNTDFYYNPEKDIGSIPKEMIIEHNKKLGVETKIETTSIEEIHQQLNDMHQQSNTHYKGEHIDTVYLEDVGLYDYAVSKEDGITYNAEKGVWEYKGLEVKDYDAELDIGTINIDDINIHNEKVKQAESELGNGVVQNKYINKMSEHLEPVKENGEIYIIDKRNGKKYVYDEKAIYERKQDDLQKQINYNKQQFDSTAHWGQYGHQILNGLIYGIEKYGYDVYKPYLEKALPKIDKIRAKNKEIYFEKDITKRDFLEYQRDELINQLGEIIDKVPRQSGCYASLLKIQNAMWEMVYMDEAIIKTPRLAQDTFLVRFGHFAEELCEIGKDVTLEGYTSTTYESGSASHFEEKMAENPNRWAILIMADEGSSGIRLNNQFDALTSEREWLLPRDQTFEVVGFNKHERTVILKVKENKNYI